MVKKNNMKIIRDWYERWTPREMNEKGENQWNVYLSMTMSSIENIPSLLLSYLFANVSDVYVVLEFFLQWSSSWSSLLLLIEQELVHSSNWIPMYSMQHMCIHHDNHWSLNWELILRRCNFQFDRFENDRESFDHLSSNRFCQLDSFQFDISIVFLFEMIYWTNNSNWFLHW